MVSGDAVFPFCIFVKPEERRSLLSTLENRESEAYPLLSFFLRYNMLFESLFSRLLFAKSFREGEKNGKSGV